MSQFPSIDRFRQNFEPIHANRFRVLGSIPNLNLKMEPFEFYVKATQLPGSTIGVVTTNYRGRKINVPAERGYSDWAFTFYSTPNSNEDFRILFENWMNKLNSSSHTENDFRLVSDWAIYYSESDNVNYQRIMYIYNCFPSDISSAEMSNDVADTFLEFTVSMTYDYYTIESISGSKEKRNSSNGIGTSNLPPSSYRA